ncbi:ATP phosphoribosyltransferase [Ferroplasma sp.]|uniref:ATP phosphoribosyltransferase n=1 Tax=Ferroplasma sp. TaxID=2591003 RepID=UPI00307E1998
MKFVIPKGRLMDESIQFLKRAGIGIVIDDSRKLIFREGNNEIILPRARDVPVYTEYAGDIGICGSDTFAESQIALFTPLSLNFGKCRLSLIAPKRYSISDFADLRIATKHPNITRKYFWTLGMDPDIITLNGSLELAPETGIADAIVDIVQTGETMRKNNLIEVKKIMDISAIMVINRVSQKIKYDEINNFIEKAGELNGNGRICKKYIE